MISLYRPTHRRTVITDRPFYGSRPAADVQNDARCSRFGEPGCSGMCPRHDPIGYSEHMAVHAIDSIRPHWTMS